VRDAHVRENHVRQRPQRQQRRVDRTSVASQRLGIEEAVAVRGDQARLRLAVIRWLPTDGDVEPQRVRIECPARQRATRSRHRQLCRPRQQARILATSEPGRQIRTVDDPGTRIRKVREDRRRTHAEPSLRERCTHGRRVVAERRDAPDGQHADHGAVPSTMDPLLPPNPKALVSA
jgi:hypothetical protein